MARFDKSSTKSPQQDAALAASRRAKKSTAPSIEDTMFFPRLRRHAKWMFVFLAVALGGGFVLFGVGAGGTGVGDISPGRRREQRPVGLERAEEDRGEPEGSRSLARAVDRLPGRRQDGRGDRGAEDGRRAGAEGHERAPRAREPLPRPGERQAASKRRSCRPRPPTRAPVRDSREHSRRRTVSRSSRTRSAAAIKTQASPRIQELAPGGAERIRRERQRLQADRRDQPEGSERSARARAGRSTGRRRGDDDQRLRGVPEARARRSERADRQATVEAAARVAIGIDSRHDADRLSPESTAAGHRARRARRSRSSRCRLRRDRRLHRGDGRQDERQGAVHREVRQLPHPRRRRDDRARSARTSTTRSPSRGETGSARARSCRSSGIRSPTRSRRRRPARRACRQNIVTGQDAIDVSTLRRKRGRHRARLRLPTPTPTPTTPAEPGAPGDAAAGKVVFTDNCGGCHTLSDAGTNGTIGPNLDDKPAERRARDRPRHER